MIGSFPKGVPPHLKCQNEKLYKSHDKPSGAEAGTIWTDWANNSTRGPVSCHQCQMYIQIASFMGPTWDPHGSCRPADGPHVGPMNLAIWVDYVEYIGAGPLQRNEERSSVTYWKKIEYAQAHTHIYSHNLYMIFIYACFFLNVWHIDKSYIYCFTHIDAHATHILKKTYFANTTITPSPPPHLLKWCHSQRQVHPMMIINFWRWASLDYTNFRWLFSFMLSGPASRTYRMYTCAAFKNHACPHVPSLKDTKNNSIFSLCQCSVDTLVL